jgi:hypothetical protein
MLPDFSRLPSPMRPRLYAPSLPITLEEFLHEAEADAKELG